MVFLLNGVYILNKKLVSMMVSLITGVVLTSGCAPMISGAMNATVTDDVVFEKTAKYFGVSHNEIKITSIDKGVLETSYQVRYAGKFYNCSIYYGSVTCKQPGA